MRLFTKTRGLFVFGLLTACQPLSSEGLPTENGQYLPVSRPTSTPTPVPTPTPTPTSEITPLPWVEPVLWGPCPKEDIAEEPRDVAISQDGAQIYVLSNQEVYRIDKGRAIPLKNSRGQCLGLSPTHMEIDSQGNLFFATPWAYENKYQGVRIHKTKPDLSDLQVWGEYNSRLMPTPEATPPGNQLSSVSDLYVSAENQVCIAWRNQQGGIFHRYQFFPFSSTGKRLEALVLVYFDGEPSTGPLAFGSAQVPIVYHDSLLKHLIIGRSGVFSVGITFADSILSSEALERRLVMDARVEKKSGNLIIIDQNRLVRMDIQTKKTIPIAGHEEDKGFQEGKNEARFNFPQALDLDAAGNIYVADSGNRAIRKITPDGMVSTLYRAPTPSASP